MYHFFGIYQLITYINVLIPKLPDRRLGIKTYTDRIGGRTLTTWRLDAKNVLIGGRFLIPSPRCCCQSLLHRLRRHSPPVPILHRAPLFLYRSPRAVPSLLPPMVLPSYLVLRKFCYSYFFLLMCVFYLFVVMNFFPSIIIIPPFAVLQPSFSFIPDSE